MFQCQLDKAANQLLEQIEKTPKIIKPKKTATNGKRKVTFYLIREFALKAEKNIFSAFNCVFLK